MRTPPRHPRASRRDAATEQVREGHRRKTQREKPSASPTLATNTPTEGVPDTGAGQGALLLLATPLHSITGSYRANSCLQSRSHGFSTNLCRNPRLLPADGLFTPRGLLSIPKPARPPSLLLCYLCPPPRPRPRPPFTQNTQQLSILPQFKALQHPPVSLKTQSLGRCGTVG